MGEHAVLVAVDSIVTSALWSAETSLDELQELAKTAGVKTVGKLIQARPAPDPSTYIGKGKLSQLKDIVEAKCADVVITDDELSPAQYKALEKALGVKVIDRTGLILDIFASRAHTKEAMLQVELAQLEYLIPRLTRLWTHLSRTGGGIGTRGPGETQLESDRRQIRQKISSVKKALEKVKQTRETQRARRSAVPMVTASLVGYTNAGKSTLLNQLTEAHVVAEDKLFATLDPTTRQLHLPNYGTILVTDTVGFIQKLPHHLVTSFRATLEEVHEADIILHVVDVSNPHFPELIKTSRSLLEELDCHTKPTILVFNKVDALDDLSVLDSLASDYSNYVVVSAKERLQIGELFQRIEDTLAPMFEDLSLRVPLNRMDVISLLHEHAHVSREEYHADCVEIDVTINSSVGKRLVGLLYKSDR